MSDLQNTDPSAVAILDRMVAKANELHTRVSFARLDYLRSGSENLPVVLESVRASQQAVTFWTEQLERVVSK